jgi:fructose-1,6-bisphosphatase/inositol monophosphatase family enzyme
LIGWLNKNPRYNNTELVEEYNKVVISSEANNVINLRAFGATSLGLPVVVAGALSLVSIVTRWDTKACLAALIAEEQARLFVLSLGAPPLALPRAFCSNFDALAYELFWNGFWLLGNLFNVQVRFMDCTLLK